MASTVEIPYYLSYRSRGTLAAPSAVLQNDGLMGLMGFGYDSSGWFSGASFGIVAEENWTATNHGSGFAFATTPSGSGGTMTEKVRITGEGRVGIGTASPSVPLQINSSSYAAPATTGSSQPGAFLRLSSNATSGVDFGIMNSGTAWIQNTAPANLTSTFPLLLNPNGGNVGIGNTNPSYPLDVTGQARFTGGYTTSDIRYKRNIASLENSLDDVLKLRGVSYDFRVDEYPRWKFSSKHQVGLIAQEVEKVYPQVVETDKEGFKSVNYQALVSPIIEAIKELYHKYLAQEEESKAQKALIQEQAKKIQELESRLEKIEQKLAK